MNGNQMIKKENWKTRSLLIGALIGLVAGLGVTWIQIRKAESENRELHYTAQSTAKMGITIFDIVRRLI